jgi:cyclic beta-1,2-glucan synthetase
LKAGILTAYFLRRDEARAALRVLGGRGFRRAVSVALPAVLLGGLAGAALLVFRGSLPAVGAGLPTAGLALAFALLGALLGWAAVRRSKLGVQSSLLADHSRWLANEETVLILQAPIDLMRVPVAILRQAGEIPPLISVLNPKRAGLVDGVQSLEVPLSLAQLKEHARRLALESEPGTAPPRNTRLLERLKQARQWIHLVCSDLAEAALREQRTTPIAEWILDNEYIIEGNVRDVQQNLPRRFCNELPVLESKPYRGLPRIYALAKELVTHAGLRLDRENAVAFVEAYQAERSLTTAELWATPQMLRLALIEGIQDLAAR